jgi:signal transduction histidine kinase
MAFLLAKRRLQLAQLAQQGEFVLPGVRPVTLLIACGIVLVTAILIVTGVAAGHLRKDALGSTQIELARIDLVLAEANNRSFATLDGMLKSVAGELRRRAGAGAKAGAAWMGSRDVHDLLKSKADDLVHGGGISLIDASGRLVNASGDGPVAGADLAGRDYFAALKAGADLFFGTAVRGPGDGVWSIPFARRLTGPGGDFLGVVVIDAPVSDIEAFFGSVPISDDAAITLLRSDGMTLARYPADGSVGQMISRERYRDIPVDGNGEMIPDEHPIGGVWKMQSIRALRNYPLAVLVTRGGDEALAGWSHQALVFGAFALAGALVVAAMVALIARQFRVYAVLTTTRAEKIEMERARFAAEAELLKKERLSVLGQLTATVAHELRNPLSAIRNTLFTIKEIATAKGVSLDRPSARMERSIERCDRIIGDLLEYTKQRELRLAPVNFDHWLEDVVGDQNLPAGVTLSRELQADDAVIAIDSDRIRRVIINLIDNAVQAMVDEKTSCPEKRVTLHTRRANGRLELIVEDTGPGIPPENLARIFEPLFSTKSFGTGLGLATVKQIVTQHDGAIRVNSEPGHGTRVIIELPLGEEEKEVEKVAA